ncbi:MAG: hypothetical protein GXY06_08530 [Clostridiaceae bacterium]|nr:hypothetical protein [Clostridiaceae bacterium]
MKKLRQLSFLFVSLFVVLAFFNIAVYAAEDDIIMLDEASGNAYTPIVIDGSFSDWSDKPSSPIYYSASQPHTASLYRDEDNVYLRIKMSDPGYAFVGNQYKFLIDGKDYTFDIVASSGSIQNGLNNMDVIRSNGYQLVAVASARLYRQSGQPDEMEMMIPLDYFYRQPNMLKTITFSSSNLGTQSITATGVSTMPIFFVASGLVAIAAGYIIKMRKQKA